MGYEWTGTTYQQIKAGQLADIAVLDRDYFAVAEDDIINIEADLTLTGGKVVHAKARFAPHAPAPLPELPDWSPVPIFGAPGAAAADPRTLAAE